MQQSTFYRLRKSQLNLSIVLLLSVPFLLASSGTLIAPADPPVITHADNVTLCDGLPVTLSPTVGTNGFINDYDPSQWVIFTTNSSDGTTTFSADKQSMTIVGGDSGGWEGTNGASRLIPYDAVISFDWSYESFDHPMMDYPEFRHNTVTKVLDGYDLDGAYTQSGSFSLSVSAGDDFAIWMNMTDACCGVGIITLSNFKATTAGGAFQYQWEASNGGVLNGPGDELELTVDVPGTYTLTVTDDLGASSSKEIVVMGPIQLTVEEQEDASSYGEADGSATVAVTGGVLPYTYHWNTSPNQTTAEATGLAAGTYTVTVTDQTGCTTQMDVEITEPPASTNADLADLTIGLPARLIAPFDPAVEEYEVWVRADASSLTVSPTLDDLTATLTVDGSAAGSGDEISVPIVSDGQLVEVSVTAQDGTTVKSYTLHILVNTAPTISGTPDDAVYRGDLYSFTPLAEDDGDDLTYSITNMPAWADFDMATGALTGTPGRDDVGVHAGIVIGVSDGEFVVDLPAFSIEVVLPEITGITFTDDTRTYTGLPQSLLIDGTLPEGVSVSYTNNDQVDAGVYTVTAHLDGDGLYEDLELEAELEITKADIVGVTFDDTEFVYDGTEKVLEIGGTALPAGASVSYLDNARTDAGSQTATATIDGGNNYNGFALEAELEIIKADIVGVTFEDASFVCDGTEKMIEIGGTALPAGASVSYTIEGVAGNGAVDAGVYALVATVDGGNNYSGFTMEAELEITKADMVGVTFEDAEFVYDGTEKVLEIGGTALPAGASVSYLDNARTEAGTQTATATIDGGNNYKGFTLEAELEITKADIVGVTFEDAEFVYDGTEKVIGIGGTTLPPGASVSYTIEGATGNGAVDAGVYALVATIDGGNNYKGFTLEAELEITKADIVGVTFDDTEFVYDGTEKVIGIGGTTLPPGASVSYTIEGATGNGAVDAGVYALVATIDGGNNYKGFTLEAELEITKADIVGVTFDDTEFVYDGTEKVIEIGGTTLPTGASVSYTIEGATGNGAVDAGVYALVATIDGGNNYKGFTLEAELEITKADITGVTFEDAEFVYDGTEKVIEIGGTTLPTGASVSYTIEGATGNGAVDAGVYALVATIDGGNNYKGFTLEAELEITKADITGVTFEDAEFVYDGTEKVIGIGGTTLPTGASVSYTDNARTDAGSQTATATIDGGNNYNSFTRTANLQIIPAQRSINFPALPTKTYGDPDFALQASSSSGETITYSSNNPQVATIVNGAIRIQGAGSAVISATVPENPNYATRPTITQQLTVQKAAQTLSLSGPSEVRRNIGRIELSASSTSGLDVHLEIDSAMVATVDGHSLVIHRLGTVTVTATQSGNDNYLEATPVSLQVRVLEDLAVETAPNELSDVRVHQAMSPNGDGVNDFLIIEGIGEYAENKVTIFNMQGVLIWEARNYDNSSVVFTGKSQRVANLPAGTYFYIIEGRDNGIWKTRKGFFVLRY